MKVYNENEVKQLIKDTLQATMRGMMNWYESDNTWIEDKDTKQRIENCELQANRDVSRFNNYIKPAEGIVNNYHSHLEERGYHDFATISKDNAIDAIHEYHNQFKSEWVSVEDRLPPVMEYILTWCNGQDVAFRILGRGHENMPLSHFKQKGITHWQPLPIPPKV